MHQYSLRLKLSFSSLICNNLECDILNYSKVYFHSSLLVDNILWELYFASMETINFVLSELKSYSIALHEDFLLYLNITFSILIFKDYCIIPIKNNK